MCKVLCTRTRSLLDKNAFEWRKNSPEIIKKQNLMMKCRRFDADMILSNLSKTDFSDLLDRITSYFTLLFRNYKIV